VAGRSRHLYTVGPGRENRETHHPPHSGRTDRADGPEPAPPRLDACPSVCSGRNDRTQQMGQIVATALTHHRHKSSLELRVAYHDPREVVVREKSGCPQRSCGRWQAPNAPPKAPRACLLASGYIVKWLCGATGRGRSVILLHVHTAHTAPCRRIVEWTWGAPCQPSEYRPAVEMLLLLLLLLQAPADSAWDPASRRLLLPQRVLGLRRICAPLHFRRHLLLLPDLPDTRRYCRAPPVRPGVHRVWRTTAKGRCRGCLNARHYCRRGTEQLPRARARDVCTHQTSVICLSPSVRPARTIAVAALATRSRCHVRRAAEPLAGFSRGQPGAPTRRGSTQTPEMPTPPVSCGESSGSLFFFPLFLHVLGFFFYPPSRPRFQARYTYG